MNMIKWVCVLVCISLLMGCQSRSIATISPTVTLPSTDAAVVLMQLSEQVDKIPLVIQTAATSTSKQSDYDYVTQGIDFGLSQTLSILHPAEDIATYVTDYYLTGTSDPAQELPLNGESVAARGKSGSFALSVSLREGNNVFKFKQGGRTKQVTIKQGGGLLRGGYH